MKKNLEAFETWSYRKTLISLVSAIFNHEVLRRMEKGKELIKTVRVKKLNYLGHVMKGISYNSIQIVLERNNFGKRTRGRNGYLVLTI